MSINNLLNIGRHAIGAHRSAMELASHNATNVATEGYSRRRGTLSSLGVGFGRSVAAGVSFQNPRRVIDAMSNGNVRRAHAEVSFHRGRQTALQTIEAILAPQGGAGVSESLNDFFGAVDTLTSNPSGKVERTALVQASQALAQSLNHTAEQLDALGGPLVEQVQDTTDTINTLAQRVARLNKEIAQSEPGAGEASELRDERDRVLDQLSELAGVQTVELKDGSVTVSLGDGQALVSGDQANTLRAQVSGGRMSLGLTTAGGGAEVSVDTQALDGELLGQVTAHNKDLGDAMSALDEIAFSLATAINDLHSSGFGLDGQDGRPLFEGVGQQGGAATFIQVNSDIVEDPDLLAATTDPNALPGGTDLALAIGALREQDLAGLGGVSASQAFIDLQADFGGRLDTALDGMDAAQSRLAVFEGLRTSTRGVSLDEELSQMMTFQRGFEAATRVVQAADEMMQTVLSMV